MTRRTPLLAALTAAGAATALAAPGAALAVTGHANKKCYSHVPTKGTQPIIVGLNGGTPGGDFQVVATNRHGGIEGSTTGTFDAAGNAFAQITDVFPPSGSIDPLRGQRINLAVKEYALPGFPVTPLDHVLITNLTMKVAARPISPRKRRRVTVSGTPFAHKRVYGFVVKGKHRKVLRRFKLGRGNVCGYVRKKVIVAPRHYHLGRYRLYINAGKHLHRHRALRYDFRIYRRYF